ncbi:hypothetical protein ABIE09_002056 [Lysobacter enzymogenes]|uniref:S8 family peptidase n=1 Tax=Lysobacter enzymogenes TaxID=69 RepID=UPI003392C36A
MTADPNKPLLRVVPEANVDPRRVRGGFPPRPESFSTQRQRARFDPKFNRLADVLARDPGGMSLRADPTALAPERLLVFELRASISSFLTAVRQVQGLELIDEEAMGADESDDSPTAYLLVPDARALREVESLWRRWSRGENLGQGYAGWRDAFSLLRDLRPWGAQDRVDPSDAEGIREDISDLDEADFVRIEVELVYRAREQDAAPLVEELEGRVAQCQGRVISRSRIESIGYQALLVELPVSEIRRILDYSLEGIAGLDSVMHIRPQSVATSIDVEEPDISRYAQEEEGQLGAPIVALLDGVPIAGHALLDRHLVVDDIFNLEPISLVSNRKHGTAMASLVVHGDRNKVQHPLRRRVHVVPVICSQNATDGETFPAGWLLVDMIYSAVRSMRDGDNPSAAEVIVVNISLGNRRQMFHGRISAWARLLDRLSFEYGILFVVSAGNVVDDFVVPGFMTGTQFEDSEPTGRAEAVMIAVNNLMAQRRIISPAESVNAITVGSSNEDFVSDERRRVARTSVDPYVGLLMANPSSALGPGFGLSVKPDVLMPGSRERLMVIQSGAELRVVPGHANHSSGLKVASTPSGGGESQESYTNGTSAAAALVSRTCHLIHDALSDVYGAEFTALSHRSRAVLLKALVAHNARWPVDAAEIIRRVLGPQDARQHVKQKDNVRRFLGYGVIDADSAVACAEDRATFWAVGEVRQDQMVHVPIPIPALIGGVAQPHSVSATVAWFTPTVPGSKTYRSVRLRLIEPEEIGGLGLKASSNQPDTNQGNRGTLFSRRWEGARAAAVSENMDVRLHIQREPDQVGVNDDAIPFGLAVTIEMPGAIGIYEQVRQRLGIEPRVPV